jgi:hypothetical protein
MAVLVSGLGLGWVARNVRRVEEQSAVVAQLRLAGVQLIEWKSTPWALILQVVRRRSTLTELQTRRRPLAQATPSAVALPRLSDAQIGNVIELLGRLPDLE